MVLIMVENKHNNGTHTSKKSVEWIQQIINVFNAHYTILIPPNSNKNINETNIINNLI
jgi:hypothetical protein